MRGFFGDDMPRPAITGDSAPFWAGCARRELLVQHCLACGTFRMNPSPVCYRCRSFAHEWVRSAGRGTVYSYTIVHHPVHPAMKHAVPYNAVVVQLDDCGGVRLTSNVVGCSNEAVRIGMPVEVVWEEVAPDLALYRFQVIQEPTR